MWKPHTHYWSIAGRWFFGLGFVLAGVLHFVAAEFFMKAMPPYIPYHLAMVYLSGVFEILLGAGLCFRPTSRLSAWGLIALLIAVFPANVHIYLNQDRFPLHPILHLARLPFQAVLILWAFAYTREERGFPILDASMDRVDRDARNS